MTDNPILTTALELAALGYSVIPIRDDGTKAPAPHTWKQYTQTPADEAQIRTWFTHPKWGLGVVQGAVSGAAELTEVEGRAAHHLPQLRDLAHDTGLGDLWDTITTGWVEVSPSGGFHFHYRLTDATVPGNTKLARSEDKEVLAETRGEGGQVVVAPTPGTHHPTGRPWTRLLGGPATAPTITLDQRDAFHSILRTLDTQPEPPARDNGRENMPPGIPARTPGDGITPGDDYEQKVDWADILVPHGWQLVTTRGRTRYWLRPGKPLGTGFSATTGHADDRDRLYVFTTSTEFQAEVPYTKLGALAVLEHGGNHSDAAKALARDGYGAPASALTPDPATVFDDILGAGGTRHATNPRRTPSSSTPSPPPPPVSRVVEDRPAQPNEDNTALLLVDTYADEIRYSPGRGTWLTWNGHRWQTDDNEHVRELTRTIARRLPTGEGWAAYTKRALSANGVTGILRLAQSDARTIAPTAQLDARPYELNTPAGVVDLRTTILHTPDPAALHTRSTTVAPDFDAPAPRWEQFLADTFAGDPAMTEFIQRLIGLSLVGVVLEQIFPFAHGAGANGKTTLLSVIQHLVGTGDHGYAMSAPASLLLATRSEGHPTELARLSGARLVVTSELEDNQRFAEAKIKLLTGKDTITGRFMRQDFFDFTPTHTLWLLANHRPDVRTGGNAFWRRVRLLPFEHTVPPEKRIADLEEQLITQEGPAILAWALRGARDYFAHGLAEPPTVTAATDAYQYDQDTVARFVEECCETGPTSAQHMRIRSGVLRASYEAWCKSEGEEPVNPKAFTIALRTRFDVIPERSSTARFLAGIRLIDDTDDTPSAPPVDEPPTDAFHDLGGGW